MKPTRTFLVWFALCAAALLSTAWPQMDRPLDHDEGITAKLYASLDYTQTMAEMRAWPRGDWQRMARGMVKCFLNNWTPNNHIVNSLAISGSIFLFGVNEIAIRLPALIGGIIALLAIMWMVKSLGGSDGLAGLTGLLLVGTPMFITYAVSARGYTITLALAAGQIMLFDRLTSRGCDYDANPTVYAVMLISVTLFANLASMLFLWVIPFYAFARPWRYGIPSNKSDPVLLAQSAATKAGNRRWLEQAIVVLAIIGVFILSSLRHFLTAQEHYGLKAGSRAKALQMLTDIFGELFPGALAFWALAGLCGILLTCYGCHNCWISRFTCGSLGFTIAYSLLTGSTGYARTYMAWIIFIAGGTALLWRRIANCHKAYRIAIMALLVAIAVPAAGQQLAQRNAGRFSYSHLGFVIHNILTTETNIPDAWLTVLPYVYGTEMLLYLPSDMVASELPAGPARISVFISTERIGASVEHGVWCVPPDRKKSAGVFWPLSHAWDKHLRFNYDGYRLYVAPMRIYPPTAWPAPWNGGQFIGIWIADRTTDRPEKHAREFLHSGQAGWEPALTCFPLGKTHATAIFGSTRDELALMEAALQALKVRHGGQAFILLPD